MRQPTGRRILRRHETKCRNGQRKLHNFSESAKAKGKEAGNAAENDLNEAWTKAEAASRQLQTIGAEGWERQNLFREGISRTGGGLAQIHPEDR
jgi:hypothetical protein